MDVVLAVTDTAQPPVRTVEVRYTLILDGVGNPIVLAQQIRPDETLVLTANDGKNFQDALSALGITRRVAITKTRA